MPSYFYSMWHQLPQPIFGLAPMDGVTDPVYRTMIFRHGPPDVLFTEFVSAEGLSRKIPTLLRDLKFEPAERPIVAQIYGYEPEAFRQCVPILAQLGFDGIDINMGCPAKNVVHHGGGAALIKACPQAKTIIKTCAQALDEWYDRTGRRIPLSVKTRLGYEVVHVKDWIGQLLESQQLSNISIHGRTLKQGYTGVADWEAIAEAAELAKGSKTLILGNGDLQSFEEALQKIRQTGVNGVLFGRATFGNPWFFKKKDQYRCESAGSDQRYEPQGKPWTLNAVASHGESNPSEHREREGEAPEALPMEGALPAPVIEQTSPEGGPILTPQHRFNALLEHARLLQERKGSGYFIQIRKHAGWYLKSFAGASELRARLVRVNSLAELESILHTAEA